jgi:putative DNA primase/helicase
MTEDTDLDEYTAREYWSVRQEIQVNPGELPNLIDTLERAHYWQEMPRLFNCNGQLCEIVNTEDGPRTAIVGSERYRDLTQQLLGFRRFDRREKVDKPCDLSNEYSRVAVARHPTGYRPLRGIYTAFTVDAAGNLVAAKGYHPESGIFIDVSEDYEIPANPDRETCGAALSVLEDLLGEFPFENPGSLYVAIAAMITGLVRHALPSAPVFGFSAPTSGTGKSLLAEIVGIVVTGRVPVPISLPPTEEEAGKVFSSVLMSGAPLMYLDNLERPLEGEALCTICTQSSYQARILGTQQVREIRTLITILATGNNLAARGDMRTRLLTCQLNAKVEHPEGRSFRRGDLRAYALANRRQLVTACLTILRGYLAAGLPKVDVEPFGRFEKWSDWVRSALVWLGANDPCETRSRAEALDERGAQLAALLDAWHGVYGEDEKLLRDVRAECASSYRTPAVEALREACLSIAGEGDSINPRKLGKFIAAHESRICGGFSFARGQLYQHAQMWRAVRYA